MAKKKTDWTLLIIILFVISLGLQGQKSALVDTLCVDISQEEYSIGGSYTDLDLFYWGAQGFTAVNPTISAVGLSIYTQNSPVLGDLTVSIRSSLTGPDLTSATVNLANQNGRLMREIDIPDLAVTPGNTYYIVARCPTCAPDGVLNNNFHVWSYKTSNTYLGGSLWQSTNSGASWTEHPDKDQTFITYTNVCAPNLGDANGDGVIDWAEVNAAVTSWISGVYSWPDINTIIQSWVGG